MSKQNTNSGSIAAEIERLWRAQLGERTTSDPSYVARAQRIAELTEQQRASERELYELPAKSITLRLTARSVDVLRSNEWTFESVDVDSDDVATVVVSIDDYVCQPIDMIDAARHCVNRLAGLSDDVALISVEI